MAQRARKSDATARGVAVLILATLFLTSRTGHTERGEFKVKEIGSKLEVTSPWGIKTYTAATRLNVMKSYRIDIPLSDLKPVGAEEEYRDWFDMDDLLTEDLGVTPREVATSETKTTESANVTVNNVMPTGIPTATPTPIPTPTPTPVAAEKRPEDEWDDTPRLIVEANRFYNQGKYYEALVYVDEVLRKKPKFVRAWVMKGSLLYVQGHKDLAREAWQSVLTFDPQNKQIEELLNRYK